MKISTKDATEFLLDALSANLVPMLSSSPGVGKSTIIKELAAKYELKVIDLRLSQCDPTDLMGFPSINKEGTKSGYVPMNTFPIEGDPIPDGYRGWLLLLDEFNSAPLSVQAAAYKVVLDKQVGEFNLHKDVAIVCAGNLTSDKAITNRMSTAMQSRLIHLEIEVDSKAWVEWAQLHDIDYRVVAYINFRGENLHNFNPSHNDYTFPCPRTWEFVSNIIKNWTDIPMSKVPILAGTIGEGAAREFMVFTQIFESLPTIDEILQKPEAISIPTEPSIQFAVTGMVTHNMVHKNCETLMQFINRLPIEFQALCLRGVLRKDKTLLPNKGIQLWIKNNAMEIL